MIFHSLVRETNFLRSWSIFLIEIMKTGFQFYHLLIFPSQRYEKDFQLFYWIYAL